MTKSKDYFAIILIGGGSSWGRAPDKETAIKNAVRSLRDWSVYYDVSNIEVTINVIDVTGYASVDAAAGRPNWLHGTNEATGNYEPIERPVEVIKRTTPKWRVKRRA